MGQLVAILPSSVAKGLVRSWRTSKSFAGARRDGFEGSKVGALAVASAAVAGADSVGKQGRFEGRAHESARGVWEIGCAGGGVGEDIAFSEALPSDLLLELGFDAVEGEILPAMLGLELGESETVL